MTKIFAHRGSAGTHPENTMIAFQEALRSGADGIELDVQMSKDGKIVVIHDERIDRTTNGIGWVKDYTYRQLRQFDASYKFAGKYGICPIPSLEEVLSWAKDTSLLLNIELKNGLIHYSGLEQKVIQMVQKWGMERRVILSSFNHMSMALCHQIAPYIETALLYMETMQQPWHYIRVMGASGLHPSYATVTESFVQEAHRHRIAVRPFTVNKETMMRKMCDYKVDAIITDYPEKARNVLGS